MIILPENKPVPFDETKDLKVFLYGDSYLGKSHLANTFPNVFFASTDGNLPKKKLEDGTIVVPPHILLKRYMPVTENGLNKNVSGWTYFKELVDIMISDDRFETIVIDFFKDLWDWMRQDVLMKQGATHESETKGRGKVWDTYENEIIPVFKKLLTSNKNVVVIAHENKTEDGVVPDIFQSVFRKMKKYFGISGWLSTQQTPQGVQRVLHCQVTPGSAIGNRYQLNRAIYQPTYDALVKAIRGE